MKPPRLLGIKSSLTSLWKCFCTSPRRRKITTQDRGFNSRDTCLMELPSISWLLLSNKNLTFSLKHSKRKSIKYLLVSQSLMQKFYITHFGRPHGNFDGCIPSSTTTRTQSTPWSNTPSTCNQTGPRPVLGFSSFSNRVFFTCLGEMHIIVLSSSLTWKRCWNWILKYRNS